MKPLACKGAPRNSDWGGGNLYENNQILITGQFYVHLYVAFTQIGEGGGGVNTG